MEVAKDFLLLGIDRLSAAVENLLSAMGFGVKYEKRKRKRWSMLNKKEEGEKKGNKGKKEEMGSKRI